MDHQPGPRVRTKKSQRDRLIRLAASHPRWALGFQDEVWWSRVTQPHLHAWCDGAEPLHLVEQAAAAAESMREQAESLSHLVSRFKLDDQKMREEAARSRRAAALSTPAASSTSVALRTRARPDRALPANEDGEWTEF